jgi:tetratricopeptide (TPR) repeat protein
MVVRVEPDVEAERGDDGRSFNLTQLCRMLDVTRSRVRGWIQSGLIHPLRTETRLWSFDFREVTRARALLRLTRAGATRAEIHRSLSQLGRWLPGAEVTPGQLEAAGRGGPLMVRLEDGRLAETSGQLCFDFAHRETRRRGPLAQLSPPTPQTADQLFEAGLIAETEGRLVDATLAYQRALLVGGPEAEIAFNLGNALYAQGLIGESAQRFMQAVEIEPDYAEAWNNLGSAFADLGQFDRALDAFENALRLDPGYADARSNLQKTLEQRDM